MTPEPTLLVQDLHVSYGEAKVLFGVDLRVAPGEAVAVLGANGAGKSTLAGAVAGVITPSSGTVRIGEHDVTSWPAHRRARAGLAYVPEGRGIFPQLSVVDNLRATLRHAVPKQDRSSALEKAMASFPVLGRRSHQAAGTLSGGEQQMLALAKILVSSPRLLVADEMSLGLAPLMVDLVFESLETARRDGVSVLLVEQYVDRALEFADRAVVLRHGRVAWEGPAERAHEQAVVGYLG